MVSADAAVTSEPAAALPVAQGDPAVAAFFDVDNTMMVGASIYHFARGMAARKLFTWADLARFGARQAKLRLRGESHTDLHRTRESALAFVAGKEVSEIVALGEQIYDDQLADKIWPGTLALANAHLGAGERVWLVTATPVELATIIADRLHLTGALGTVAEARAGRYTGHLVGDVLHGSAKAEAVRELARREGLDLARCYAYSDSINDLPLLSLVGHPVAVNPDSALRGEAKQRGWPIKDFRTGRKAVRVGAPVLGAGLVGVAVGVALRRSNAMPARAAAATVRAGVQRAGALRQGR